VSNKFSSTRQLLRRPKVCKDSRLPAVAEPPPVCELRPNPATGFPPTVISLEAKANSNANPPESPVTIENVSDPVNTFDPATITNNNTWTTVLFNYINPSVTGTDTIRFTYENEDTCETGLELDN
jgi:hypothetical protein